MRVFFFFQAEDGIRDVAVTGVQTCALPIYDLGRGQIPPEAHLPGRAKRTGEWTAGLRRDANGTPSVAVAHQDGLHWMAVTRAKQCLDRAVLCLRFLDELERRKRHLLLELRTQGARNVRH